MSSTSDQPGAGARPGLELRLLGELQLVREGRILDLPASRKTRALLGYLVATRRAHLREELCALLWDGPDDPRGSLRWSLSKVRPLLDDPDRPRLVADRERVRFDPLGCRLDLDDVEALTRAPLEGAEAAALARAAARFRGSFLQGLDLPDCPPFHAWCAGQRAELDRVRLAVLEALILRHEAEPEEALRHARVRVAADPLVPGSHAHVVRLLGRLGRLREARQAHEQARLLLARELGEGPFPELERARFALPAAIRPEAEPATDLGAVVASEIAADAREDAGAVEPPPAAPAETAGRPRPTRRWLLAGGAALAAAIAGARRLLRPAPFDLAAVRSLAVLPLADLTGDSGEAHFADGLTDALITDLAGIRALRVVSRQSVMRYRNSTTPLPEVARELGVDAVVVGSVLRSGGRVRVAAQLLHGPSDRHLWAGSYDRALQDVLRLQSEVTREIAREIRVTLTPGEEESLTRRRPVDPIAYDLYARGRYFWHARAGAAFAENVGKAIALFEQAIAKDPGFALAHAALAESYVPIGFLGLVSPAEAARRVREAAGTALRLDSGLVEAQTALAGSLAFFEWDWAGAERAFRRALELNPNYGATYLWYAALLGGLGRQEENLAARRRAIQLDPFNLVLGGPAYALALLGRHDEAVAEYRKALDLGPGFANTRNNLGRLYLFLGRHQEALAEFERTGSQPDLAQALARAGRVIEARRILTDLTRARREGTRYVSPLDLALIQVALRDHDAAFEALELAYRERTPLLLELKVVLGLRPLAPDPRLQALARRMNLP